LHICVCVCVDTECAFENKVSVHVYVEAEIGGGGALYCHGMGSPRSRLSRRARNPLPARRGFGAFRFVDVPMVALALPRAVASLVTPGATEVPGLVFAPRACGISAWDRLRRRNITFSAACGAGTTVAAVQHSSGAGCALGVRPHPFSVVGIIWRKTMWRRGRRLLPRKDGRDAIVAPVECKIAQQSSFRESAAGGG
jgi:hypothetical protein